MAFTGGAGAKTFSRTNSVHTGSTLWQQDEAAATGIVADRHDLHDQDLATAINTSLQKNGDNALTANIPAAGFGFTGLGTLSTATEVNVSVASTTDVLAAAAIQVLATGASASITSLGSTAKVIRKRVRFDGINTLTHNATSLILPGGANITTASGDVMDVESDASGNARVTNYQRAAVAPAPATAAGEGMRLLVSGSVSAAATLDLVLTSYTGYRGLKFFLTNFRPASDGVGFKMQFSTNGGGAYDAGTGYNTVIMGSHDATGTPDVTTSGGTDGVLLSGPGVVGNAATEGCSFEVTLLGQTSTAFWGRVFFTGYYIDATATPNGVFATGGGAREAAQDTDAVRFLFSSGNITSGDYAVYGLA